MYHWNGHPYSELHILVTNYFPAHKTLQTLQGGFEKMVAILICTSMHTHAYTHDVVVGDSSHTKQSMGNENETEP